MPGRIGAPLWFVNKDAEAAWRALWALVVAGGAAAAYLGQQLSTVPPLETATAARYRDALDSDKFAERDKATRELRQMGSAAEPLLVALLQGQPTLELRVRVEVLLKPLRAVQWSPAQVRIARMLETLERIGSKDACAVLADLARGAPDVWLTRQAACCVQRLDGFNPQDP
jgi:hypothetical protein